MTEVSAVTAPNERPPPKRPPLRQIHKQPIPVRTFPLPSFYPSNPISLFHLAYVWVKQILLPPPTEPSIHILGQWNPESRAVHITDPQSIRTLWKQGFWGKGNLSRSEPNWIRREKVRRGLIEGGVSEEFTVSRREDRQKLKWQRAIAEQQEIERTKALELKAPVGPLELLALPNSFADLPAIPRIGLAKMREALDAEKQDETTIAATNPESNASEEMQAPRDMQLASTEDIHDREHLQLCPEESFYLAFALGTLSVLDSNNNVIPTENLFTLFGSSSSLTSPTPDRLSPSDPFLIHYVVYHHFRSLGWCPRSGVKFGADWLLYLDGPVFNHGEFGVIVVPSFSDPSWKDCPSPREYAPKSWHWLMGTVRVLSHVFKHLVLVYVDVPPPADFDLALQGSGITSALRQYRVREVMVRRWSSNRNR